MDKVHQNNCRYEAIFVKVDMMLHEEIPFLFKLFKYNMKDTVWYRNRYSVYFKTLKSHKKMFITAVHNRSRIVVT